MFFCKIALFVKLHVSCSYRVLGSTDVRQAYTDSYIFFPCAIYIYIYIRFTVASDGENVVLKQVSFKLSQFLVSRTQPFLPEGSIFIVVSNLLSVSLNRK